MANYYRPTPDASLKSTAITAYASGAVVSARYDLDGWFFDGASLTDTTISGTAGAANLGSLVSCGDGASGVWVAQTQGSVVNYSSGGVTTAYALATASAIVGAVYTSGSPYFLSSNGTLATISGAASAVVGSGVGASCFGLSVSGSTLFTLIPGVPALGTYSLGANTSGAIAAPITVPSCLAATSGAIAVGGWAFASLGSGFSSMAISPANNSALVGANPTSGLVSAWGVTQGNTWAFTSVVSGLGAPTYVSWVPNGLYALATDPTNGTLYNFTYSLGVLTEWQAITLAGAGPVAMLSDSTHGLVCRTAANQVVPLTYTGSNVATGTAVSVAAPSSISYLSSGHMLVGCASGLARMAYASGAWSVQATGAVGFTPTSLYVDASGNAYCAATSGASGVFAVMSSGLSLAGSGKFPGSAVGIVYQQGQTVIADGVNGVLRGWGPTGGTYSQYASAAAPAGLQSLVLNSFTGTEQDIFAAGSTATWQLSLTAPYTPTRVRQGVLSVYASGAWASYALPVDVLPQTLAWDPSGNISASMLTNSLYTFTSGATFVSSGAIGQQPNIGQAIWIGVSNLLWLNGHLFASTGLNDSILEIE